MAATFAVGECNTIAGLPWGVAGVRVGDGSAWVVIWHTGTAGVPGRIPPNAKLLFEVELIAVG